MERFNYIQFIKFQKHFLKRIETQGKSVNTINSYKTDFRTFGEFTKKKNLRPVICDLTPIHARLYTHYLEEKYKSSNTRRKKIQSVRIFYDYLAERKKVEINLFRMLATSPKILNLPEPTTIRDMRKIWNEFAKEEKSKCPRAIITAKRNRCVFLLIVGCNLRPNEIALLEQSHIVFSGANHGRILITNNDKEPYTIPIPEVAIPYLKDYIKYYNNTITDNDKRLFFGTNGTAILQQKLKDRGVQKIFERYSKKLKIKSTPKTLRQSCILRWINNNTPESIVKDYMGVAPIYDMANYKQVKGRWNLELQFVA